MKMIAHTPWLLALVPLAVLAAEPAPSPKPAVAAPPAAIAGAADGGAAATDAGPAAAPAAPQCSLEAGVDRTAPSSGCVACHTRTEGGFDHGGHRVEIAYEPYGKELRPNPLERGVNVVLPGGRVTCLTCHDPQSKMPDHLAAPVGGPVDKRLCTACHLFD